MPNYTTNLNLEKPLQSEQYNINVFNANADKIDQFAGQVPARALTADKLTTGAKINGVNFKGDTDVVTGAGFYYDTVTYGAGDLAFIYNQDGALELHKSLSAGNIGHNPLTSTGYWEKVELGGSGGRNVGEIITSSLPLTDAGLHLLDGTRLSGDGIYKGFVDYVAKLYNDTKVYNPSAFTVVGNPTITDDGIASGFSSGNYLSGSFTAITPSKFIFRTKVVYSSTPNTANGVQTIVKIKGTNSSPSIEYDPIRNQLKTLRFHTNSGALESAVLNITLNDGDIVEAEAIATSTSVTLNAKINGVPYTNTWSGNGLYCGAINGYLISNNNNWYWTGSIDLKQFSIIVDGVEVFSGGNPANYFTDETDWQASVTQYGSCGKFVYDSELNTVRLPKVSDILQCTTDISALGDLVEESLPNITGTVGALLGLNPDQGLGLKTGVFSSTSEFIKIDMKGSNSALTANHVEFNANNSSSVYQDNAPVQPQTIKALLYIVVATSTKTDIQVDIDGIATDLNGKADVDLTNTTDQAKILMGSMGMPSDKYIDLTLGASGSTYTAPANGYYRCYIGGQSGNKWLRLATSIDYIQEAGFSTSNNISFTVPVQKGQTLNVKYSGTLTAKGLRFLYAQGSESEA